MFRRDMRPLDIRGRVRSPVGHDQDRSLGRTAGWRGKSLLALLGLPVSLFHDYLVAHQVYDHGARCPPHTKRQAVVR